MKSKETRIILPETADNRIIFQMLIIPPANLRYQTVI